MLVEGFEPMTPQLHSGGFKTQVRSPSKPLLHCQKMCHSSHILIQNLKCSKYTFHVLPSGILTTQSYSTNCHKTAGTVILKVSVKVNTGFCLHLCVHLEHMYSNVNKSFCCDIIYISLSKTECISLESGINRKLLVYLQTLRYT